ncbi:MAG: hypothetical protein JKY66_02665 [Spongiibacteraceae bacterium]|nr:hypothetical protein [Spongiibacteraceae bacterium]
MRWVKSPRLVSMDEHRVSFRWKDYASNGTKKTMVLEGVERNTSCAALMSLPQMSTRDYASGHKVAAGPSTTIKLITLCRQ